MSIQTPREVAEVLSRFDAQPDLVHPLDVAAAVWESIRDRNALTPEARRGQWAEWAAFGFCNFAGPDGGPWKTYFQPVFSMTQQDGTTFCRPDLSEADAEVLAYWAVRAKTAKHPVLVARYADLVWDTTAFVTKAKRGGDKFEFALLAVDSYIAASRKDDGLRLTDTITNLTRALQLALSIKHARRTGEVVSATMEYLARFKGGQNTGIYCRCFDNLLPSERGPELAPEQEQRIVDTIEAKFREITTPGSQWDVDPHSAEDIGTRLAGYYSRKGKPDDRTRVLSAIAQAFERRANIGDAMAGLIFRQDARKYYVDAGAREEAERVQLESQRIGPEAEKRLVQTTVRQEIPQTEIDAFLGEIMEGGIESALRRLAIQFIPDQANIAEQIEKRAKADPLYSALSGRIQKLGDGQIRADLGNDAGDPDGKMVHETAEYIRFQEALIACTFQRMISDGLTAAKLLRFIRPCPLFTDDRLPLLERAFEAHLTGDYVQAIHLLIPQIERALVNLLPVVGRPSNKAHRTGRGVMQAKNLNDVLAKEEWPVPDRGGENARMYFTAVLAHPKGMNIRNHVSHGLWPSDYFTRPAGERVLHVLLVVSLLCRAKEGQGETSAGPTPSSPPK